MSKINKKIHLEFIKSSDPFEIKCSFTIFISEEINILLKYGNWFSALEKKQLVPFTCFIQSHFFSFMINIHFHLICVMN